MNRRIYIILAYALAFPLAYFTAEPMRIFAEGLNTAGLAPYAYRVLFLWLWDVLSFLPSLSIAWLLCFFTLAITAVLIDETARRHGNHKRTQLVLFASFAMIPVIVLAQASGSNWNLIEMMFYAAAVMMILDGRKWALYPLVLVATLNRETAVFIPLMYFAVTKDWKHTAGMGIVWAAVYGAVRLIVGPIPLHVTLADILEINLSVSSLARLVLGLPFVGWLFWYAWKGWRGTAGKLRRLGWVIPAYLLSVLIFGVWTEWRLMLSLYPLLVPLAGLGEYRERHIKDMSDNTYVFTENVLSSVKDSDDSPLTAITGWEVIKTAEPGEWFTDFHTDSLRPKITFHLDSTKGKYTGRPNADGGIDWEMKGMKDE